MILTENSVYEALQALKFVIQMKNFSSFGLLLWTMRR